MTRRILCAQCCNALRRCGGGLTVTAAGLRCHTQCGPPLRCNRSTGGSGRCITAYLSTCSMPGSLHLRLKPRPRPRPRPSSSRLSPSLRSRGASACPPRPTLPRHHMCTARAARGCRWAPGPSRHSRSAQLSLRTIAAVRRHISRALQQASVYSQCDGTSDSPTYGMACKWELTVR